VRSGCLQSKVQLLWPCVRRFVGLTTGVTADELDGGAAFGGGVGFGGCDEGVSGRVAARGWLVGAAGSKNTREKDA